MGTLTVTGNYVQTAEGSLTLKIAAAGQFDRLAAGGRATLAGTLQVMLLGGYSSPASTPFRVLTAAVVGGVFDALAGDEPLFDPAYDGTGLTLRRQ